MKKNSAVINEVLERIESLDIDNQAYISEVLSKRLIEQKRQRLSKRALEADQAFREGKVKKGSAADLLRDLND